MMACSLTGGYSCFEGTHHLTVQGPPPKEIDRYRDRERGGGEGETTASSHMVVTVSEIYMVSQTKPPQSTS